MDIIEKKCGRDVASEILQYLPTLDLLIHRSVEGKYDEIINKIINKRFITKLQKMYDTLNIEEFFCLLRRANAEIVGEYILEFILDESWKADLFIVGRYIDSTLNEYLRDNLGEYPYCYISKNKRGEVCYSDYNYAMNTCVGVNNSFDGTSFHVGNLQCISERKLYTGLGDLVQKYGFYQDKPWDRAQEATTRYNYIKKYYEKRGLQLYRQRWGWEELYLQLLYWLLPIKKKCNFGLLEGIGGILLALVITPAYLLRLFVPDDVIRHIKRYDFLVAVFLGIIENNL